MRWWLPWGESYYSRQSRPVTGHALQVVKQLPYGRCYAPPVFAGFKLQKARVLQGIAIIKTNGDWNYLFAFADPAAVGTLILFLFRHRIIPFRVH